jgi:multidrug efflux pump subunit AcrA (membrane-fusion protein)
MDPAPLARLAEDVAAAEATASASSAERQRTRALWSVDGNVSRKVVEAADAQASVDQAHVRQLRAQLRLEWGATYASLTGDVLRQRVLSLVEGHTVLLRAQVLGLPPAGWSPRGASLTLVNGGTRTARVLGSLPRGTSGLAADWLLEADGRALVSGMHMAGYLEDSTNHLSGVVLPRSAVIRWNGLSWAYVAVDATHFERRAVNPLRVLDDGWLVGAPFKAGEHAVTNGANALMAIDVQGPGTATDKASAPDQDD